MTRLGLIPQLTNVQLSSSSGCGLSDRRGADVDGHVHGHGLAPAVPDAAAADPVQGAAAMRARGREVYIIAAVVAIVLIVAWYFLLFSPKRDAS